MSSWLLALLASSQVPYELLALVYLCLKSISFVSSFFNVFFFSALFSGKICKFIFSNANIKWMKLLISCPTTLFFAHPP